MRSSNPVLTHLDDTARTERQVLGQAPASQAMTIDDVVVRTVALLVLTTAVAAVSWFTIHGGPALRFGIIGGSIGGIVLALVISFRRITNPAVISLYAILQGVLLGVASRGFEELYPGIVIQAVVGTLGVFLGMAVLYKLRIIRATPRFTRFVIGALIGVVVLGFANLIVFWVSGRQGLEVYTQTGQVGWVPYVFAIVCIGVGALTFILDFAAVEQGIRYGLPRRYAWYCAFGMLVGLIYLYWQILRLLSYIRR
ncbi:Bax inhibitor-1/YccA family protein [Asanoa sp. NPDC049573]|uniref:Bax inhibitor-1/YccA family protein n=1 Tax=Asanoa sp. NPDC049573 TaxID=3155396 RepID=UPI003418B4FB